MVSKTDIILLGKRVTRRLGWEVHRYRPRSSEGTRLHALLSRNAVDLVVDVGANTGQYGQSLRDLGHRGAIVSFEPLPDAYQSLSRRAARDGNWQVAPCAAVGDTEGEVEINVAANSASSSILPMHDTHLQAAPESAYTGVRKVRLATLDTLAAPYLDRFRAPFLKVDTQGYEAAVLRGADSVLRRVVGVQIEASLVELYEGQILYRDLIARLENYGFELFDLLPGFSDPVTGRLLQMDCVFQRQASRA